MGIHRMSANADILDSMSLHSRNRPKWLPYTLIAIGEAAVVVPIVLLRQLHPADAVISKTLYKGSAPPVRKAASNVSQEAILDDGPFMALKAFGIATCMVAAGALASVWVVRATVGVQTVDEFADKMRNTVQSMTTTLSSRIYRRPTPSDDTEVSLPPISTAVKSESHLLRVLSMSRKSPEGGFAVWMEVAGKELEKEASAERSCRDHGPEGSSAS
ncbi:hypothetical protein M422DRAFT_71308 [Sphaerobolus stellatus SS14]|uniref:Uncharacterized protein n=1 Tax=Sphaerobolus stellatus (strain SS14) TaxID=990650 RepID=A0A0C9THS9_SPHS4|nr:hypothetical protein M422DRAFT_71308 [Sphaerobolus stellatus SS14]